MLAARAAVSRWVARRASSGGSTGRDKATFETFEQAAARRGGRQGPFPERAGRGGSESDAPRLPLPTVAPTRVPTVHSLC